MRHFLSNLVLKITNFIKTFYASNKESYFWYRFCINDVLWLLYAQIQAEQIKAYNLLEENHPYF